MALPDDPKKKPPNGAAKANSKLRPKLRFRPQHNLHPSNEFSAPLIGEICCHAIDNAPPFNAQSYIWGLGDKSHQIQLQNKSLAITASLDEALR